MKIEDTLEQFILKSRFGDAIKEISEIALKYAENDTKVAQLLLKTTAKIMNKKVK